MSRWITVANRLPFSVSADANTLTTASGGLVSALNGVQGKGERLWLGCAPDNLTPENWPKVQKMLSDKSAGGGDQNWSYQPVFVPKPLYDSYYNGLCNDVLWPLLHYQPELVSFTKKSWDSYREVNERVAAEINAVAKDDDLIWIHDFHLFLVPKLLKALRPGLRVGFFLHVPFPSSELYRQLPVREEILESLLSADLIGFHDYSYLQHFCSSVLRLLGVESEFLAIRRGSRVTRLGVFPVSIDTEVFMKRSRDPKVRALTKEMERPQFTFLGVDRLDYMKGLDLKLKSFRAFLRRFPQYREKVCLIQVAVPTRTGVPVYMKLASATARLVGEINGEFSTPTWSPIQYIHASVSADQLVALYKSSDALMVSSKRDGMNLVALEYIASQDEDRPGVVLLSEFAGASSTMSHALAINPWDFDDTARKMQIAMEMPKQEKAFRAKTMQEYLERYDATTWAESFISELEKQIPDKTDGPPMIDVAPASIAKIRDQILALKPSRIALFCDYDGTLVPIEVSPELAVLTPQTRKDLRFFSKFSWLDTVFISGRDSRFLEKQFEGLNFAIAAEHGAKYYDPEIGRWNRRIHRSRSSWYPSALKIMSDYAARTPGSQIEKKHFSIAWHYRQSPNEYADVQSKKLAQELELGLANLPVSILRGKKVIEVRAIEADKGVLAGDYLGEAGDGTIAIAIGDDRTDEDLFSAVKGRGVSIRVGPGSSVADFALNSQAQVMSFLHTLLISLQPHMKSLARTPGKEGNPIGRIGRAGRAPDMSPRPLKRMHSSQDYLMNLYGSYPHENMGNSLN